MLRKSHRLLMTFDDQSSDPSAGGGTLPDAGGAPGLEGNPAPTPNEWDAVPRSWPQEQHPHWTGINPAVRQFLHKREADVEKGIRTYYDGHQRWDKLRSVFKDDLARDPNLDVGSFYESLARNHLALSQADPESRREMLMRLAQHYGVDFAQQGSQGSPDPSSQFKRMLDEALRPIHSRFQQQDTLEQTKKQQEAQARVDQFYRDPKNKYIKQVEPQLMEIIQSGVSNLDKAYELAVLSNPEVRQLYLAELAAGAVGAEGGGKPTPAGRNVKSGTAGAPPATPASMDDTMKEVVRKYYGNSK